MSEIEGRPEIRHGQWEPDDDKPLRAKPTLGLKPRKIHLEHVRAERMTDVRSAIVRYMEAGKEVPVAWLEEWNDLTKDNREKHPPEPAEFTYHDYNAKCDDCVKSGSCAVHGTHFQCANCNRELCDKHRRNHKCEEHS